MDKIRTFDLYHGLGAWKTAELEAGRFTPELNEAVTRVLNSLWAAAHNPNPPPTFAEDAERFRRQSYAERFDIERGQRT